MHFASQGHSAIAEDILVVTLGAVTDTQGAEARETANHPRAQNNPPHRSVRLKMSVVPTVAISATPLAGKGPIFQVKKLGTREAVESGQSHTAYKQRTGVRTQHCLMLPLGFMSLPHTGSMKPVPTKVPKRKEKQGPFPGSSVLQPGLSSTLRLRGSETQFPSQTKAFSSWRWDLGH